MRSPAQRNGPVRSSTRLAALLPGAAALLLFLLAGCGVGSDTVCHDVNNPCLGGLVCQSGACVARCDDQPSVCGTQFGCDVTTGRCLLVCDYRFYFNGCPTGQVCSGALCHHL